MLIMLGIVMILSFARRPTSDQSFPAAGRNRHSHARLAALEGDQGGAGGGKVDDGCSVFERQRFLVRG